MQTLETHIVEENLFDKKSSRRIKGAKRETGREETETWQTDRGQPGKRQIHGRQTEDRQGRDIAMAGKRQRHKDKNKNKNIYFSSNTTNSVIGLLG
jgi:hypothetical protein